jgi:uncharacterized membrane protein
MSSLNAPSVACWSLMVLSVYLAIKYSVWLVIISIILLFLGIHYYNKERERQEAKERKEKEDQEKKDKDKASRDFWGKIGQKGANVIIKKIQKEID